MTGIARRLLVVAVLVAVCAALGAGGASSKASETTLTILETNTTGQAWPVLIGNFERVYPDVKISANYLPGNQLSALLLTQLQAGNAPDVFHVNAGGGTPTNVWPLAKSGNLAPLDGSPWIKRVFPPLKKWMSFEKHIYAMPASIYATGFFYNKDVFSQYGLKIPTRFPQLLTMCAKLKAAGVIPIAIGLDATGASNATLFAQTLMTDYVYANDPNWTEKRLAHKVTFASSPLWQQAFQRFVQLKDAGCFTPGAQGSGLQQQLRDLATGKAAMSLLASVQLGGLLQANPNLHYGMFAFPADNAKETQVPIGTAITLVINKSTHNLAAAKQFVNFMARPKQSDLIARITGGIEPFAASKGNVPSFLAPMAPLFKAGNSILQPFAGWPNNNMIFGTVYPGFQGIFAGSFSATDVLQNMDKTWDSGPQTVP